MGPVTNAVTKAHLGDLTQDPDNARQHNPRNVGMIEDGLNAVGAARSIVIDENGRILAGNATTEAAAAAGIEDVIIVDADGDALVAVRRSGLTEEQKLRLALYDNRTAELAAWDPVQLDAFNDDGFDFSGLFSPGELDMIFADLDKDIPADPGADVDHAAELQEKWQVERGQVWQIGRHRLMCGDSTSSEDVGRLMDGKKAGAVVTDPPYGINQEGVPGDEPENLENLLMRSIPLFPVDNAVCVAFQSPRTFPMWLDIIRNIGHTFERALWLYKEAQESFPWRGWILKSEMIIVSSVGKGEWTEVKPYSHDCYKIAEVSFRTEQVGAVQLHGSIKPLAVVSDIVSRVAPGGSVVYDPFLGSGTTLVACEQTGRIGYGMEIDERYASVTLERLQDLDPRLVEK